MNWPLRNCRPILPCYISGLSHSVISYFIFFIYVYFFSLSLSWRRWNTIICIVPVSTISATSHGLSPWLSWVILKKLYSFYRDWYIRLVINHLFFRFLTPFEFQNFEQQVTHVLEGHAALTLRSRLRCIIMKKTQNNIANSK